MEEARRLGRKYARDEMNLGDTENLVRRQKKVIPRLKQLISNMRDKKVQHFGREYKPNSLSSNELSAIDFWLKELRIGAPQIKTNMGRKKVIEILEEHVKLVEDGHKMYGY